MIGIFNPNKMQCINCVNLYDYSTTLSRNQWNHTEITSKSMIPWNIKLNRFDYIQLTLIVDQKYCTSWRECDKEGLTARIPRSSIYHCWNKQKLHLLKATQAREQTTATIIKVNNSEVTFSNQPAKCLLFMRTTTNKHELIQDNL